ncbi:MAG: MarR family transcriptional regulator [Spirochaetales bacterium]|nr:MarR family transcriptional regulator [Spirochaetales bacterium]
MFQDLPLFTQVARLHFSRAHTLLAEAGLHPSQYHLLTLLNASQGLSQHEIAKQLLMKPSTLTIMLRRLERDGMVEKKRDTEDKRVFRIYLSPSGEERLQEGNRKFAQLEEELYRNFSPSDRDLLERLATLMRDNLLNSLSKEGPWCQS